jgi:hypothetical protein
MVVDGQSRRKSEKAGKKDGKLTERSQYAVENKESALENEPKTKPIQG